jgi:uncharacterized protein YcnI
VTSVRSRPRPVALLVTAVAVVLLAVVGAAPADAHPFVRGGEMPVDSVATITLAMAHGCGTEDAGGGDPTLEVALEVPDAMRIVEVADDEAYEHDLEAGDDGRIEVVTWSAAGEGEPAPDLDLDVVVTGDVGEELYLPVFQGCEGFAYRWVGTPDEPADDPAVGVILIDADPDAPAPAEDEPTPAEQAAAAEPEEDDLDDGADAADEDDDAEDDTATDDATEDEATTQEDAAEEDAAAVDGDPAAIEEGGTAWWLLAVAAVAMVALGVVLARRSRVARGDGGDPA